MVFSPEELPRGASPYIVDACGDSWVPVYRHECSFGPAIFTDKMMNLIKNPNINSSWLFRADIIYDDQVRAQIGDGDAATRPRVREFQDIARQRVLVRTLIPRNERRDAPLHQTCTSHASQQEDGTVRNLIIYIPHVDHPEDLPFYHPTVQGVAHLHEWHPSKSTGSLSIHYLPFPDISLEDKKLQRTAYQLLQAIYKHGQGAVTGYVKRVHHDLVVPQVPFQNRYASLKLKYASDLCREWQETTDPQKHVFEDLGIAAFLIELWTDMYNKPQEFPGFVDIGCGNGLLVYILNSEGYHGWGFDARERKSWAQYTTPSSASPSGTSLEQRLLLPSIITGNDTTGQDSTHLPAEDRIHTGVFPPGTFIVSNHADELTPWTPILAAASDCPWIAIPCCSHDLSGRRFRAPFPRDKSKSKSTFASLVDWVARIAEDCGWTVETEMLRIPSTRNVCLLGRTRSGSSTEDRPEMGEVISKYGGAVEFRDSVVKLLKGGTRSH